MLVNRIDEYTCILLAARYLHLQKLRQQSNSIQHKSARREAGKLLNMKELNGNSDALSEKRSFYPTLLIDKISTNHTARCPGGSAGAGSRSGSETLNLGDFPIRPRFLPVDDAHFNHPPPLLHQPICPRAFALSLPCSLYC